MSFPEQTKAMKKSQKKALVFEDGSIPSSFRAFEWDGFWPGKSISLDGLAHQLEFSMAFTDMLRN
jgi:hypothetical protein